jgi:hypothetical protein
MAKMNNNKGKLHRIGDIFLYQLVCNGIWYYYSSTNKWIVINPGCELEKALFDLDVDSVSPLEFLLFIGRDFYKSIRRLK